MFFNLKKCIWNPHFTKILVLASRKRQVLPNIITDTPCIFFLVPKNKGKSILTILVLSHNSTVTFSGTTFMNFSAYYAATPCQIKFKIFENTHGWNILKVYPWDLGVKFFWNVMTSWWHHRFCSLNLFNSLKDYL